MPEQDVEKVREAFEDFLAGRPFGANLLDPDVEWDATDLPVLDIGEVFHGTEGVRQFWREWLAAWETVEFEYELVPAGDRVVALIDQWMRGRTTGIEMPIGKYAQIYRFRDGKVVHWKLYMSQAEALEAAGLSPP